MTTHRLLLLPGDGIGVETVAEVERVIAFLNKKAKGGKFETESDLVGGASIDKHGTSLTDEVMAKAEKSGAVIFGAVGGPKWDKVPYAIRPEAGLLRLRKDLGLFANLRPAICYPALADASSLKRELVEGLNIMIVRELTGGVYFGEPKEIVTLENGEKRAVDTQVYYDARDRAHRARRLRPRPQALKQGPLRREAQRHEDGRAVERGRDGDAQGVCPDVELQHILADNCAMQLVRNPKQFDVIVTDNLFGDVLSDEAAQPTGSLGMLPSASLGAPDAKTGRRRRSTSPCTARRRTSRAKASPIPSRSSSRSRWPALLFRHGGRAPTCSTRRSRTRSPLVCAPPTSCSRGCARSARPRWAPRSSRSSPSSRAKLSGERHPN